ncbi:MAG: tetratricopeptide repeat protein [Bacteroidetes bacterium]|nr:tetratricopeptide repeat protein [Bacteroidota bacterium]
MNQHADKLYKIETIGNATFINYPDGRKIPRYLTKLPFKSDYFIGREADMQAIERKYQEEQRLLVLVNGDGGIGKTTLAAKYWYAYEVRYTHFAWLYIDTSIANALISLAPELGVRFDAMDDQATQLNKTCHALTNLAMPCLLILDNANEDVDLKSHFGHLHALGKCHIILTSRVKKLDTVPVIEVKPLSPDEVATLFKNYYEKLQDAELPLLHEILKAVDYNTLVAEILAKNLAVLNEFDTAYTLEKLLADLRSKGLLAIESEKVGVVYQSHTLLEATPNDIISAMYDLSKLAELEIRLLSNFAVLPAEKIPHDLFKQLLKPEDEKAFKQALSQLVNKGWLEHHRTDNSFKISPVIQEVTKAKNAERLLSDCRILINVLINGLDNENRHTDNYRQATVLARLGEAVVQAMPTPDFDVANLCQNIGNYHKDTGNINSMMQAYQRMVDLQTALLAAEPDNADFKNGLAVSYSKLGETHTALGNLDKALGFYEKDAELSKELHDAFPNNVGFKNGLAVSYSNLGNTHTALGNLDKALGFYEELNRLEKELHDAFPNNVEFKNGLAVSYFNLGNTHTALGNLDKALGFYEDYNRLEKELHDAFPNNVGFKNGLAVSYAKLGEYSRDHLKDKAKAKAYFQQAAALWEELVRDAPGYVEFKRNLEIVQRALAGL